MGSRPRAASVALLGCIILSGCGIARQDPTGVEKRLQLAVPLHSSPAQVLEYLDHQKLAHSKLHRDETFGNVIETEVPVKSSRSLVDPSYDVFFVFDDQGHLTQYNAYFLGYIGL